MMKKTSTAPDDSRTRTIIIAKPFIANDEPGSNPRIPHFIAGES
jgi:hypothetical protein